MRAALAWTEHAVERHPELVSLACFGSYARGDCGVGSDLDLFAVVDRSPHEFWRRTIDWDTDDLPVPTDLLVYTSAEWRRMRNRGSRLARVIEEQAVWLYADRQWQPLREVLLSEVGLARRGPDADEK